MNVYLINGSSYHLIDKEINKIINPDDEIIKMNYLENDINDIFYEINCFSLDGKRKVIIIKNCDIFGSKKSENTDKILDYLKEFNKQNVVIFICNGVDSRKKIVKEIKEKFKYIEIKKIDYKNIYECINDYLNIAGFKIDYKGARYLVSLFGLNLDLIYQELDKIMLYYENPLTISYNDVLVLASKPLDSNSFHFVDACVRKDAQAILDLYHDLKVYKIDEFSLVILLAREYRLIFYVKKMTRNHLTIEQIIKELVMQEWQVRKIYNEGLNYSEKELLKIIKDLAQIDESLKMGLAKKDTVFYNFILNLIN